MSDKNIREVKDDSQEALFEHSKRIYERLQTKREDDIELAPGINLKVVVGDDPNPELEYTKSGWMAFILPQEISPGTEFFDNNGNRLYPHSFSGPLSTFDVERINIGGRNYWLGRDAWNNPTKYLHSEVDEKFKEGFKKATHQIIEVWESAVESEEEVGQKIEQILGKQVYTKIAGVLDILVLYPDLQKVDDYDLERIMDLQKSLPFLPKSLYDTPIGKVLLEIRTKVQKNTVLEHGEDALWSSLRLIPRAMQVTADNPNRNAVSSITRRFMMANLAEDFLLKQFSQPFFDRHQKQVTDFVEWFIKIDPELSHELKIRENFTAYTPHDLKIGFAVGRGASHGDRILLSLDNGNGYFEHILMHERLHNFQMRFENAASTHFDYLKHETHSYKEVVTDTFATLMRHKGDVKIALAEKEKHEFGGAYESGVKNLLLILQEMEAMTNEPFIGVKKIVESLAQVQKGETRTYWMALVDYYNHHITLKTGITFEQKMSKYDDSKQVIKYFSKPDIPRSSIDELAKLLEYEYGEYIQEIRKLVA